MELCPLLVGPAVLLVVGCHADGLAVHRGALFLKAVAIMQILGPMGAGGCE